MVEASVTSTGSAYGIGYGPDPSTLTTAQLNAAIHNLQQLVGAELRARDVRIDGVVRAAEIFAENLTRVPTDVDKQVGHIRVMLDEKIDGVIKELGAMFKSARELSDTRLMSLEKVMGVLKEGYEVGLSNSKEGVARQFHERDVRTDQAAIATKIAVDAALSAQKEAAAATNAANAAAINKSEIATDKRIEALSTQRISDVKASDEKIADLKSRLDRGEGAERSTSEDRGERRADTGLTASVLMAVAGIGGLIVTVVTLLLQHH